MRLFDHLEKPLRERLVGLADEVHVTAGEMIIRRGELSSDVYRILKGSLEVVDSRATPEAVLDVLGPGAVVGEMAFLEDRPRSADVRVGKDAELLCWRGASLHQALEDDPDLGSRFYRAAAAQMSVRLRAANTLATSVGGAGLGTSDDAKKRGDALASRLKSQLVDLETSLRTDPDGPAREALGTVITRFVEQGARAFGGLNFEEAQAAGEVLSRELHPYLVRAKTVELAGTRGEGGGWAQLHGHVYNNEARGIDPMGVALDAALLALPTSQAIRARKDAFAACAEACLPSGRPNVLVAPTLTGVVVARLGQMLAAGGGDITCADSDSTSLAALDSGVTTRPSKVMLHARHTDLSHMVMGRDVDLAGPFDLALVDGLLDYLPDRVAASLATSILGQLRPGGWAILSQLGPSPDSFVFDHLLGWTTVRRPPDLLLELFRTAGFEDLKVVWEDEAGVLIAGRKGDGLRLVSDASAETPGGVAE